MSPNEVYYLLHTPFLADENVENFENIRKELPEGAMAIWIVKPDDSNIKAARWGTYTRSTLIAFLLLYSLFVEHIKSDVWAGIAMLMVGYEVAYTNLRLEKNKIDNWSAAEEYGKKVNKFLRKTYPGYNPP